MQAKTIFFNQQSSIESRKRCPIPESAALCFHLWEVFRSDFDVRLHAGLALPWNETVIAELIWEMGGNSLLNTCQDALLQPTHTFIKVLSSGSNYQTPAIAVLAGPRDDCH